MDISLNFVLIYYINVFVAMGVFIFGAIGVYDPKKNNLVRRSAAIAGIVIMAIMFFAIVTKVG